MRQVTHAEAFTLVSDDPVRPHIPAAIRNKRHFRMYRTESAVICTAFCDIVPTSEEELLYSKQGSIAVFYSVWSYEKGSGRAIVFEAIQEAKKQGATRFITLSPQTEMAEKFHLRNGAILLSENETTNNFEYIIQPVTLSI